MVMLRIFIIFLTTLFTLASCGSDRKPHQQAACNLIRLNLNDEPQSLDPRKARQLNSLTVAKMLFEGLTRINNRDRTELALAESIVISPDRKTYTFHLRPSVWSNNDPVTAEDFAYAWKKILDPQFPSDGAFHLYVIQHAKEAKEGKVSLDEVGIRVIDEQTLEVTLVEPTPYFLGLTSFPAFFPVNHRVDQETPHWAEHAQGYVCNGPFSLELWKHHDQLLVMKNPLYWDANQVHLDGVQFVMVKDETAFLMYEKKELDWIGSPFSTLPVDLLKMLREQEALQVKEALATYFLRCNTLAAPFNHPKIRKAFAMAAYRKDIVEHVTQGNQLPATGLVPLSMGLSAKPYFNDGDVVTARQLFVEGLEELKLSKQVVETVSLVYRATERNHLIAQALQQQWHDAFGVRIQLEAVEGKVYMDRISRQDYQLIASDWFADFNDPINFLEVFKQKQSGSNNTHWENKNYAQLLDASTQMGDREKRKQILAQSEQILIEEMPIIPLFHYTMLYTSRPEIRNVVVSSLGGVDFKWASIDSGTGALK